MWLLYGVLNAAEYVDAKKSRVCSFGVKINGNNANLTRKYEMTDDNSEHARTVSLLRIASEAFTKYSN